MTPVKNRLWSASGKSMVTCVMAASNLSIPFSSDLTEQQYEDILQEVIRMKHRGAQAATPSAPPVQEFKLAPLPQIAPQSHDWKARYIEAHKLNFQQEYPAAWKDNHWTPPVFPKPSTANGLTTIICNYLKWIGCRATRINVAGRLVEGLTTEDSGNKFLTKKYIKSSTRKGTADISSTIKGKSVMWEIKVGRDKSSDAQIAEQRRERRAGGEYFFCHNTDEFFTLLDHLMYG